MVDSGLNRCSPRSNSRTVSSRSARRSWLTTRTISSSTSRLVKARWTRYQKWQRSVLKDFTEKTTCPRRGKCFRVFATYPSEYLMKTAKVATDSSTGENMLKFLTHKLRTHSINEDNFVEKVCSLQFLTPGLNLHSVTSLKVATRWKMAAPRIRTKESLLKIGFFQQWKAFSRPKHAATVRAVSFYVSTRKIAKFGL